MTNDSAPDDCAAHLAAIRQFYGATALTSDWIPVTQEMIDDFCAATRDRDWMHVDPERARRESPFGGCVAPGFWSLAMLPHLIRNATNDGYPPGAKLAINYGFDRVRFTGPVPVGARVRLTFTLGDVTPRQHGQYLMSSSNVVEVEGRDAPALVAEWKFLIVFDG